jgi:4-diphosphocytidyl-2-C-methyl-D-erythritol kinase
MVPVTLFDYLELTLTRSGGIKLTCRGFSVPDDYKNLVHRAATAFFSRTQPNQGLNLKLTKNIPVAAGLGGGSSDAACTLMALNKMLENPLKKRDLAEIAIGLGADVPFFLQNRPCVARGIGEVLRPIEKWPHFWYVIVTPRFHVSTSWVYRNLKIKLTKDEYSFIIKSLEERDPLAVSDILENDLETVTATHFPVINSIKKLLVDAGAEGALMSGSGPSVFGVFGSRDQALLVKKDLLRKNLGDVFAVEGLNR